MRSEPALRPPRPLKLDAAALSDFLAGAFPGADPARMGEVIAVQPDLVRMRLEPRPDMLRPGGIVSGPTLMALADVAAYAVVLAHIGRVPMAVTSNLNINFLRACRHEAVTADAHLLKLGRRIAVVDVRIWQREGEDLTAQASVTYALPHPDPA